MKNKLLMLSIPLVFVSGAAIMGCKTERNLIINPITTYTKIDSAGNALVNQDIAFNADDASASESNFARWTCLEDDTTGLIWEVKTNDSGLRHASHAFSWYDQNPATNGGEHGIGDTGAWLSTDWQLAENRSAEPATGTDNCFDIARCDTEKYVADVNAVGLCGATDWRLPSKDEIATLVFSEADGTTGLYADLSYFYDMHWINDGNAEYWTSTASVDTSRANRLVFQVGDFFEGPKYVEHYIRLVRGSAKQ